MRCFKSFESADAFPDLRRMIYNFVRRDETRVMRAGIALKLGRSGLESLKSEPPDASFEEYYKLQNLLYLQNISLYSSWSGWDTNADLVGYT